MPIRCRECDTGHRLCQRCKSNAHVTKPLIREYMENLKKLYGNSPEDALKRTETDQCDEIC